MDTKTIMASPFSNSLDALAVHDLTSKHARILRALAVLSEKYPTTTPIVQLQKYMDHDGLGETRFLLEQLAPKGLVKMKLPKGPKELAEEKQDEQSECLETVERKAGRMEGKITTAKVTLTKEGRRVLEDLVKLGGAA